LSTTFADLGVPARLVAALEVRGIEQPFEVQSLTIPDAIAGRDVCGRAPTGSGKTIAFGVPVLARVGRADKRRPTALVLAPTRELAAQIGRELEPLAHAAARRVGVVYGGVGYEPQRRRLNRGVDVLVACPGRLADLVQQRAVDLGAVEIVVVDEADRLSDMGFLPEVRRLLDLTPDARQTLLFSATLDGDVGVLTRQYQTDPVRHEVSAPDTDEAARAHHVFWRVEHANRTEVAANLLAAAGPSIVFCRTRRGADRLTKQLQREGVRAEAIHGGRSQNQRDRVLEAFRSGSVDSLIATDVAARGIHVDGVACVVHFDTPEDEKAYVHRSGRTARAGARGLVVSFVPKSDQRAVTRMQRILDNDPTSTPPDLEQVVTLTNTVAPRALRKRATTAPPTRNAKPRRKTGRTRSGDSNVYGTVKFFNIAKGYGFISHERGGDVFVHSSNITMHGRTTLRTGQRVAFELATGRKGDEAQNVRTI
jgi:superfamily II DNA/RNA helicase